MQQLYVDVYCKFFYSYIILFKKIKIILKIYILICINFVGQEKMFIRETDSDLGKGIMISYGSVNFLNINDGFQIVSIFMDNSEQFEIQKQQKEIMEIGIEMLVMKFYLMKYMFMNSGIFIRIVVNFFMFILIFFGKFYNIVIFVVVMFDMFIFFKKYFLG